MNSHIVEKTVGSIKNVDRLTDLAAIEVYHTTHDTINKYEIMKEHATEEYTNESFYQESVLAGVLIGAGILGVAISAFFIIKKIIDTKAAGDSSVKSPDGKMIAEQVDLRDPKSVAKYIEAIKARLKEVDDSVGITLNKSFNAEGLEKISGAFDNVIDKLQEIIDNKQDAEAIKKIIDELPDGNFSIDGAFSNAPKEINATQYVDSLGIDSVAKFAQTLGNIKKKIDEVEKSVNKNGKDGNTGPEVSADYMKKLKDFSTNLGKSLDALIDRTKKDVMHNCDVTIANIIKTYKESKAEKKDETDQTATGSGSTPEAKPATGTGSDTLQNANPQTQSGETATGGSEAGDKGETKKQQTPEEQSKLQKNTSALIAIKNALSKYLSADECEKIQSEIFHEVHDEDGAGMKDILMRYHNDIKSNPAKYHVSSIDDAELIMGNIHKMAMTLIDNCKIMYDPKAAEKAEIYITGNNLSEITTFNNADFNQEEPKADEPKVEEPKSEESKVDESKVEEPAAEEQPKQISSEDRQIIDEIKDLIKANSSVTDASILLRMMSSHAKATDSQIKSCIAIAREELKNEPQTEVKSENPEDKNKIDDRQIIDEIKGLLKSDPFISDSDLILKIMTKHAGATSDQIKSCIAIAGEELKAENPSEPEKKPEDQVKTEPENPPTPTDQTSSDDEKITKLVNELYRAPTDDNKRLILGDLNRLREGESSVITHLNDVKTSLLERIKNNQDSPSMCQKILDKILYNYEATAKEFGINADYLKSYDKTIPTETEEPKKDADEGASKDTQTENTEYSDDAMINEHPELKESLINDLADYMKQYPDESDDEVFQVRGFNTLKISPEMAKELKTSARELANKGTSENAPSETKEPKTESSPAPTDQNTGENTQETTPETSTEEPKTPEAPAAPETSGRLIPSALTQDMVEFIRNSIVREFTTRNYPSTFAEQLADVIIDKYDGDVVKYAIDGYNNAKGKNAQQIKTNKGKIYNRAIILANIFNIPENEIPKPDETIETTDTEQQNSGTDVETNLTKDADELNKAHPTASDFENFKNPESQQRFNSEINNADKSSTRSVQSDEAALKQASLNRQAEEEMRNKQQIQNRFNAEINGSNRNPSVQSDEAALKQQAAREAAAEEVNKYQPNINGTLSSDSEENKAAQWVANAKANGGSQNTQPTVQSAQDQNEETAPTLGTNFLNAVRNGKAKMNEQPAQPQPEASQDTTNPGPDDEERAAQWIANAKANEAPETPETPAVDSTNTEANYGANWLNYMQQAQKENEINNNINYLRDEGYNNDQIRDLLAKQGYDRNDVNTVLNMSDDQLKAIQDAINNNNAGTITSQDHDAVPAPPQLPKKLPLEPETHIDLDAAAPVNEVPAGVNQVNINDAEEAAKNNYLNTKIAKNPKLGYPSLEALNNAVDELIAMIKQNVAIGNDPSQYAVGALHNIYNIASAKNKLALPLDKLAALKAVKQYIKYRMIKQGVGNYFAEMTENDIGYYNLIQEYKIEIIREEKLKMIQEQQG